MGVVASVLNPAEGVWTHLERSLTDFGLEEIVTFDGSAHEARVRAGLLPTSLTLLAMPTIFSQDGLVDADGFVKLARQRGREITLDTLRELHGRGLLMPLFRITDLPVSGRRVEVARSIWPVNIVGEVLSAGREGRLRDPYHEGRCLDWPHRRPDVPNARRGRAGFAYSTWQALELGDALWEHRMHEDLGVPGNYRQRGFRRRMGLALTLLSSLYLPSVLGRASFPAGVAQEDVWLAREAHDVLDLIDSIGIAAGELRPWAERLLGRARRRDPMAEWLPILRHTSFTGWSKLRGVPLDCMWERVAAEILLLAHEDLADAGHVDPLPDLDGYQVRVPLHDRLTSQHTHATGLERALGDFGLSPYPKVLLLVEGETELDHIGRLLAEFGLDRPQDVRVQSCDTSNVNPQLITRYIGTPRIGRPLGDSWSLDATATAVIIAMDPENRWSTQEKRDKERQTLLEMIREDVGRQGGSISQEDLEYLVRIHVWGENTYELANFSNDELIPAIASLVLGPGDAGTPEWRATLDGCLTWARQSRHDIDKALGRAKTGHISKPALADVLWPVLRAKLHHELGAGEVVTPVIELIQHIRETHEGMRLANVLRGRQEPE